MNICLENINMNNNNYNVHFKLWNSFFSFAFYDSITFKVSPHMIEDRNWPDTRNPNKSFERVDFQLVNKRSKLITMPYTLDVAICAYNTGFIGSLLFYFRIVEFPQSIEFHMNSSKKESIWKSRLSNSCRISPPHEIRSLHHTYVKMDYVLGCNPMCNQYAPSMRIAKLASSNH